jgi:hypothetical protein
MPSTIEFEIGRREHKRSGQALGGPAVDDGSVAATIERRGNRWIGQSEPRIRGLAKGH